MHKIIGLGSWDFGVEPISLVKWSSRGLTGNDLGVLVKRASSEFAHLAQQIKLAKGEIPVHLIAMGATERYGPNRNGDGFTQAALRKYANTFEKFARWYRNHKNKDPSKSYGVVKLAYYNEPMARVELLVGLNGSTKVAKDNGGLVADKEISLLEQGQDLPVSMACRVAYDVCSACGNKAPSRKDYCKSAEEGGTCTSFGCAHGLTKVADDGSIQYVDNPHPSFFDISKVYRNADRVAFGSKADYMDKAASDRHVLGGAEMAELARVNVPVNMALREAHGPYQEQLVKLAYELAEIEDQVESQPQTRQAMAVARAFSPEVQPPMDLTPMGKVGSEKLSSGLNALANQNVSLPISEFLRLFVDDGSAKYASLVDEVPGLLPGVYNRLISDGTLSECLRDNPFRPSQGLAPASQRQWAAKYAETHSLDAEKVQMRASLSAIRDIPTPTLLQQSEKSASAASGEAYDLARRYAVYKLAFLAPQRRDMALTRVHAIRQNYVG